MIPILQRSTIAGVLVLAFLAVPDLVERSFGPQPLPAPKARPADPRPALEPQVRIPGPHLCRQARGQQVVGRRMHRPRGAPLMETALQPELGLEEGSIDPSSETALRAAYERQPWKKRHSFAEAMKAPDLKTLLQALAKFYAKARR